MARTIANVDGAATFEDLAAPDGDGVCADAAGCNHADSLTAA